MIQHLVLSGGGPSGIMTYGAAKTLAEKGVWELKNIRSIYATSMGALMGVMLSLGYDWDVLDDYLVKRPWERIVEITARHYVEAIYTKGVTSGTFCQEALGPLLEAKDIDVDINLLRFNELTGIDLHVYTVDINQDQLTKVDLSHKTHPFLKLTEAVKMSAAYPLVFPPTFIGNGCFVDGGILNNYPVNDCLEQTGADPKDVLAFKIIFNKKKSDGIIDDDSTLFKMIGVMMKKMGKLADTTNLQKTIPFEVKCIVENDEGLSTWIDCMSNSSARKQLIDEGVKQGELFYEYAINNSDTPRESKEITEDQ
jgi:predicted acylesterase/phospholipase RssA